MAREQADQEIAREADGAGAGGVAPRQQPDLARRRRGGGENSVFNFARLDAR
jgi:hypothetical protein